VKRLKSAEARLEIMKNTIAAQARLKEALRTPQVALDTISTPDTSVDGKRYSDARVGTLPPGLPAQPRRRRNSSPSDADPTNRPWLVQGLDGQFAQMPHKNDGECEAGGSYLPTCARVDGGMGR
jgi:hypothetical protein